MKEREGREHWTLLPDTRQLLLGVEELTGRKVEIHPNPEICSLANRPWGADGLQYGTVTRRPQEA